MSTDPEYELKTISTDAIDAAMDKVKRYRLLNEPGHAESICRDILRADPTHHDAKICLFLCLSDQFRRDISKHWPEASKVLDSFDEEYDRLYYSGIACERRGKAHHRGPSPHAGILAHNWLQKAMHWYEQASVCSPVGDDSALLRWNTCARMIMQHADIRPGSDDAGPELLE